MPGAEEHLDPLPISDLLCEYQTWRYRFVAPVPRTVHVARELKTSEVGKVYAAELAILRAKLEAGEDVTQHLSNRIHDPFTNTAAPKMEHRTDRDALLSIWVFTIFI